MREARFSRHSRLLLGAVAIAFSLALIALPAIARADEPAPFGHACKAQGGVRFCPTEALSERVPSWDGTPMDADVTLPATGDGPWPTIVMLHGWGTSKTEYENNGNSTYFASKGYAVLTYSARGWGRSCGTAESRAETPACEKGWTHMDDTRYESRDAQYLLGVLADEDIVQPKDIGAMGSSYGGGQSMELAFLKNRIRLPDGSFAPWKSPGGKRMELKAALPVAGFSDLVAAQEPNGRWLDTEVPHEGQSGEPFGVAIESIDYALYIEGYYLGAYYAPEGLDEEADLPKWYGLLSAGEPYTSESEEVVKQVSKYHEALGVPLKGAPAPLLMLQGWTDDVFPVEQALRLYNEVHAAGGYAALMFGDVGHPPASNKGNTSLAFAGEGARFFAAKLKHEGTAPKRREVTVYTQTCPKSAPGGGPFSAREWSKLWTHTLSFGSDAPQSFDSEGASKAIATGFDPIVENQNEGGGNVCKETKSEAEPNTASYSMTSPGFTMLGLPTITADVAASGPDGQIDARLWDVLPSGEEILITRGVYRLTDNQTGTIKFQLHGNGYEFAKGDTVKLELLGRDAPYLRASNIPFSVEVSNLSASLPAR